MKTILFIALLASLLAPALCGCASRETAGPKPAPDKDNPPAQNPERDKFLSALDEIGLDKAPNLGHAYREFLLAAYDRNFDAAWELISQPSKDALTTELPGKIAQLEDVTKRMEAELQKPDISKTARDYYTRTIAENKELIPLLKSFNGDGQKYFAYTMEKAPEGLLTADLLAQVEIAGETISGDGGFITLKQKGGDATTQVPFTREGNSWKRDIR
jgi:hypothetical protein